eukprot:CAMPEP_0177647984 /NCGR_PEP_ID=MMETSP0447-20121125/10587_1 /TAXON_ID=0 /ORGANISM="Stygamoeba regulata, Strain BSH-02190019" /LENGTH=443 /DNA_ID=CAMNT_0019150597 /DNA_START=33 /DNA_END=1364 /DNA_ORIENTATION=-
MAEQSTSSSSSSSVSSPPLSRSQIHDATLSARDEMIELTQALVRFQSTLLHPDEGKVVRFTQEWLEKNLGFETQLVHVDAPKLSSERGWSPVDWKYDERPSLVAHLRTDTPSPNGRSLLFNGHLDVVPVEREEDWTHTPFSGTVVGDLLYGRGAGDMKGGLACALIALRVLRQLGYRPAAYVGVHAVLEEECTGNGALSCIHADHTPVDGVIIPEPLPGILSAQLGVMWVTVTVLGEPVHVLNTSKGSNAIESALQVYAVLKELEAEWNQPEARHEVYSSFEHAININLGKIHGGVWASSVPSLCSFEARVGFFPGVSLDHVRESISAKLKVAEERLGVEVRCEWRGFQAEGCVMDTSSPLLSTLKTVHDEVLDREIAFTAATCTTDCRFYMLNRDTQATCYGPKANAIHGIDETVSITSMLEVTEVLANFIVRWCDIQPISS